MNNFLFKDKDRMDMLALALCLSAFSFWAILLTYKFFHFGYYDWDLAFFAQGMWSLCHGSVNVSLHSSNFFSNHANLIAYLILPVYKLFPHPLTLIFLKVISYLTAAFILYVLAKKKLGPKSAIMILCLYLVYAPNVFGIIYEFDFESLAPGFLMLLFYFYVKDRWLGFIICAGILILIKENMPFIILAFSIHGLFIKKNKIRWSIIPGTLALISLGLLVYVFIPHMSGKPIGEGGSYYITNNYRNWGGSAGGILSSIIFHPIKTWSQIMTAPNINFLVTILNPLMYLPLASPGILFLASPIFAQHLLSSSLTEHEIRYAYVMTVAPVLFLAAVETLKFLKKLKKEYSLCLVLLVIINILILILNFNVFKERFIGKDPSDERRGAVHDQWELVHLIPEDASVVASFSFLAPLSQRKDLYAFYKIYDPHYQNSNWSYELPPNVQYALIDIRDPWMLAEDDYELAKARAQRFLTSGDWVILKRYGRYILYKRKVI